MFEMRPYRRNSMSAWNPFSEMEEMERRLFNNDFFSGRGLAEFKTDITDEGDYYELKADLPGFRKEDIDLDVKDGVLTISAKHQADDRTAADNYICRERRTGSFSRSFTLDGIQEDAIRASYQDGVLELILPKRQEVLPQCHKIQIQ